MLNLEFKSFYDNLEIQSEEDILKMEQAQSQDMPYEKFFGQ